MSIVPNTDSNLLVYNSFYRSANVFLCHLHNKMINLPATTNHDLNFFEDETRKLVAIFRNPYDAIASTIVKRVVDSKTKLSTDLSYQVDELAIQYIKWTKAVSENQSHVYVGHFETAIKDPFYEMKKISQFFKADLKKEFNQNFEDTYKQIEEDLWNTSNEIQPNLMTPHDGHLPRKDRHEYRILVDQYIEKNHKNLRIVEAYNAYKNIIKDGGTGWSYASI